MPQDDQDTVERAAIHAALGDAHRLAIVEALRLSDRAPSELGVALGMPSNLLAHHVDVLAAAGVVERVRSSGDRRRRYLSLRLDTLASIQVTPMLHARRVLFVCTGNSARSQFAVALWREHSTLPADSAGTHPAARIDPRAVATARRHGVVLASAAPRAIAPGDAAAGLWVTVCDRAFEELPAADLPMGRGAVRLHWSVPDPVAEGSRAAFERAFRMVERRVASLAASVAAA